MTHRVGPKGQVVVPKRIRDRIGLRPGDEVVVDEADGEVRIRRAEPPARLLGLLAEIGGGGTADLEAARREEREREDARSERLGR